MSAIALRVVDLPAVGEPVRHLRLVSQPRPSWQQLSLPLRADDAPIHAVEPSRDPQYDGMPDVDAWVRQLVVGLIEVLVGNRPPQQLIRWLDPVVFTAVATRSRSATTAQRPLRPAVSTIHAQSPRHGIVEATAVVKLGARYRAVALRLRADEGRWKCAAVQVL